MPKEPPPFYPPRAPWYAPAREVGYAALVATRVHKVPTPGKIGLDAALLGLILPGWAFVIHRRPKIGLALVAIWPVLFTLGLAFLGENAGNVFLGLAISLHATSVIHLIGPWLRELDVVRRILAGIAIVGGLVVFAYLPLQELTYRNLFMPVLTEQGPVIVRPGGTPDRIRRGDWIVHWMPRHSANQVIIDEGMGFGPVLGLPGDTVEFTSGFVRVNTWAYPRQEGMPQTGAVVVPEKHWFVWNRFSGINNRGHIDSETIRGAMIDRALVPQSSLRGQPFSRWFHRQQVLATP